MSIQEVQEIFETEDFKQKYNSYLSDLNSEELINFLDNDEEECITDREITIVLE